MSRFQKLGIIGELIVLFLGLSLEIFGGKGTIGLIAIFALTLLGFFVLIGPIFGIAALVERLLAKTRRAEALDHASKA